MNILEKSKVIPLQINHLSEEELNSLNIPKQYRQVSKEITKIGETYYHYKATLDFALTNELIGSYLAKKIGLDTVDYEIGQRESDGYLFALSKIFYEEGYSYQPVQEFLQSQHQRNCYLLRGERFFSKLPVYYSMRNLKAYRGTPFYDNNLKLVALDLKMGQYDRHSNNLQIKIDSVGTIDLAPIYDYGGAYVNFFTQSYINPFVYIKKNKATLEWILTIYPELWGYVRFLQDFSIADILDAIAEEKGIEFTDVEYSCYRDLQQANDELINKEKVKTIF